MSWYGKFMAASPSEHKDEGLRFGWESGEKYAGAYQTRQQLRKQLSTAPDELALWRLEARSLRLMEKYDSANEAIAARPETHEIHLPEGLNLNQVVIQACHRHCAEVWSAYTKCKENRKKDHEKCSGWWRTYQHCLDNTAPRIVLTALEAMAENDPDPDMDRLRR